MGRSYGVNVEQPYTSSCVMQTLEEHIRGALAAQDSSARSLHDGVARAALGKLLAVASQLGIHRCLLQACQNLV